MKEFVGERHALELRAIPDRSAAAGLQRIAESESAQAIVVGPSRRPGLGHLHPGSVSERLLSGAKVPVAIAPAGYERRGRRLYVSRHAGCPVVVCPRGVGAAQGDGVDSDA